MPLNTQLNANIQLVMNSFGTFFPDKIFSLTFPWHVSNSLTFPGFPDKRSPQEKTGVVTPPWPGMRERRYSSNLPDFDTFLGPDALPSQNKSDSELQIYITL